MPRNDDEDDYYDSRFDDRPRVRYRGDPRSVRDIVAGPANGVMWAGIIGFFLYFLGGCAAFYFGMEYRNDPDREVQENAYMGIFLGVWLGVIGSAFHGFMGYAAYKFKKLHGIAWGYIANIMGCVTVILFGLCMPTTWAAFGCGIWGIVALGKPKVKEYFEEKARNSYEFDR